MRIKRHIFLLLLTAVSIVMLSACGGPAYVPINIRDTSATVVSVKAQILHTSGDSLGKSFTSTEGFEFQYIGMRGNNDQFLPDGQFISVGDVAIIGPQDLDNDIDVSYMHIAYVGNARLPDSLIDMDMFFGLSRVNYRLNTHVITSPPLILRAETTDYTLTMGLGLGWWFTKKSAAEGRLTIATQNPFSFLIDSFRNGDQTDLVEGELALVYKPFSSVAVRAGYAMMNLTPETPSGTSPLEFRLGGPFLGLVVLF